MCSLLQSWIIQVTLWATSIMDWTAVQDGCVYCIVYIVLNCRRLSHHYYVLNCWTRWLCILYSMYIVLNCRGLSHHYYVLNYWASSSSMMVYTVHIRLDKNHCLVRFSLRGLNHHHWGLNCWARRSWLLGLCSFRGYFVIM